MAETLNREAFDLTCRPPFVLGLRPYAPTRARLISCKSLHINSLPLLSPDSVPFPLSYLHLGRLQSSKDQSAIWPVLHHTHRWCLCILSRRLCCSQSKRSEPSIFSPDWNLFPNPYSHLSNVGVGRLVVYGLVWLKVKHALHL